MHERLDICRVELGRAILDGLKKLGLQDDISDHIMIGMIERPPESQVGDFALPCFRFAKTLKMPPQAIAQKIAEMLPSLSPKWVTSCQSVNAFVNIEVNHQALAQHLIPSAIDGNLFKLPVGSKERVMIEYSQPNTHKEFHVGHTRNVCLGSALVNLFRYAGDEVYAANYFGDEGTHIAKCLWQLKRSGAKPPAQNRGPWLGDMYVAATRELESLDKDALASAQQEIAAILKGIESKTGPWFELWHETKEWSLDDFREVYRWLDVAFDRDFTESEVSEHCQSLIDEYLAKNVFVVSEGAVGADLNDYKLGFMIVRKRDGNTLYATKDLVLAKRKFEEFKIDRSIYVVASEQIHHFKQVFKTLELMGFSQAKNCFHLAYGMVVLPEGKMGSRYGNTVPFSSLKNRLTAELLPYLDKYRDTWSEDEINETARRLAVAAIKYGMLQSDPMHEIVFDIKNWLSFEGNTGPYLLYGYSRAKSVLRKAEEQEIRLTQADFKSLSSSEVDLLRHIQDFNQSAFQACRNYKPSLLCHHLYYMVKSFSKFYSDMPILKEQDEGLRSTRLLLTSAFVSTLKVGLGLIGITPPERM